VSEKQKSGWRWGKARWIVLAAILLGLFLFTNFFGIGLGIKPTMPGVFLPGERLSEEPLFTIPGIGPFYYTNTTTGLLLADLVIILLAIGVTRGVRSGKLVLTGFAGAVEAMLELLHGMTEGTAGKWTRAIFPWFATITLLVLASNWLGLLPGVETIGLIHEGHGPYAVRDLGTIGGVKIQTIWMNEHPAEGSEEHAGASVIPFMRPVSTDLNFTFALALVAVVMVQVMGFRAQGLGYLTKFWNTKTLFSRPIFGVIDFGVGLLELVSEFSKILSFAFRLFGNMFAGAVLLFVIGSLVPVFAQSIFYLLEFFVGLIQAIVFGMLTMVFMSQATQGHGEHHEEAHA
jgi:F-type H+-transporting ATPase subunit a